MFKDKYKKDNEQISADQPLKAYIKNRMAREGQKQKQAPKKILKSAVALALCACICFGAVFAHNKLADLGLINSLIPTAQVEIPSGKAVEPISYGEVFLLANKQYKNDNRFFTNTNGIVLEDAVEDMEMPEGDIAVPGAPADTGTTGRDDYNEYANGTTSSLSKPQAESVSSEKHFDLGGSHGNTSSKNNGTTATSRPSAVVERDPSSDVQSTEQSGEVSSSNSQTEEPVTSTPVTSAPNTSSKPETSVPEKEDENDYSGTNNQVAGVDEGDIIKTDGKYIYTLSLKNCTFSIIKASKGKMDVLSTTTVKGADFYSGDGAEMYILGDKVAIVSSFYKKDENGLKLHYERSRVDIFDCTDKENPVSTKTFEQDGMIHSSRLIDNKLYVISRCDRLYTKPDEDKPQTYIPCTYEGDTADLVEEDNLYLSADYKSYGFVVISSYDLSEASILDTLAVMGSCQNMYMSTSSLYICAVKSDETSNYTLLSRFGIDDGKVELKSLGSVLGATLNQFSLDEYSGNLRLVTTINIHNQIKKEVERYTASGSVVKDTVTYYESKTVNALYVLNSDLETIGKLEGIAPDERIYSARFMGNTAYFVTFRETDPLFSVDLSDPENPRILGELKIPGFSEYLHPFGSNLLFGFGQDADENTGRTLGLKLSMFNISDPANVTEQTTLKLQDKYSVAEHNHKAFLISYDKNLIAFPGQNSFLVYSYSARDGFTKKAEVAFSNWDQNSRMVYIGNYLYIFTDFSTITSLNLSDFTQIDKVTF
ncbi:MAG: beta-propeller domain-containing protein [Clostridia bacterium]|nr:beta-propeller domain-containing protein [Clostridia bacterium]